MSILKQFCFGIFLLDILIIRRGYCSQFLCVDHDEKTFWDARGFCQYYNMTLPVLETREEYQDFWDFLSTSEPHDREDLWLGLQWNNQDGGFYQWLNGNILGIRKWADYEPQPQTGQTCVYADLNKKWRTAPCSINKNVICFYEGYRYAPPYNTGATVDNFSRAYEICRDTGGRLPVIVTPADHNKLLVSTSYGNFWLGLVENDDQFVWITGKKLGFYYWYDNDLGLYVHVHHHQSNPYITMHAPPEVYYHETEHYCCQNKTTENENVDLWSRNYFRLVERNAIPLASPISEVIVRKRTQCAMACSHDDACFKYTVDGTICRTFGNMDYVVSQNGVLLFQKVRNW